jgi:hypothetical protein
MEKEDSGTVEELKGVDICVPAAALVVVAIFGVAGNGLRTIWTTFP